MRIALSADHRGFEAMRHLLGKLGGDGHELCEVPESVDVSSDYPDLAWPVARAVAGVRAACVHDEIGAEISRRHNDANVLCLAADFLGLRIIDRIVDKWLECEFDGGCHARRVAKIAAIEQGLDPRSLTTDALAT